VRIAMVEVARRGPGAPTAGRAAALAALAAVAGVVGFVIFVAALTPPRLEAAPPPGRVVAGDMVLAVHSAAWTDVSARTGARTLRLGVVLSNDGAVAAAIAPADFSVRTPRDAGWPLARPEAIGSESLAPGETRMLDLLFEVPAADTRLDLVWTHANQVRRVQVAVAPARRPARAGS
jgi:hypothetical protein